jgi:SM-20-related protein
MTNFSASSEIIAAPQLSIIADETTSLFSTLADDLYNQGYSILPNALPTALAELLHQYVIAMPDHKFDEAGIGREIQHRLNQSVRTDEICWITGESEVGKLWIAWAESLKTFVNRRLFLGLFSFESHFAHYRPGDFYKRHLDAFKGEANRILSLIVYLNPDWQLESGGELVIYRDEEDFSGIRVTPAFGTVIAFMSEDFPHEVLVTERDRYSIAGWYRINASISQRVDPPL